MSTLIKNAIVVDSNSSYHHKKVDILIERGIITSIQKNINSDIKNVIEGSEIYVSCGWIDVHAQFNDPGFEFKEDLLSGSLAAKNGGFSTVLISANNNPVTDSKAQIQYILNKSKELKVDIIPIAALSEGIKGDNFTEMYDLHRAGAIAFSDGHHPISNPDLLSRALLYSKTFNGKIMIYPNDEKISNKGVMHEGVMSTSLGLKSEPSLSEEVMVARDIAIAEYCDSPIHFVTISTAGAVSQIKRAKKRGVNVTCDVAIANLVWNDQNLEGFDSNFKVTPPLRSEKDRKALIKGVNDGTIDFVVANHSPQNIEEKQCEFDLAGFGQSSIETAYSLYNTYLAKQIDIETWVKVISTNPREFFNQQVESISIGNKANLTIFNTNDKWEVKAKDLKSKSKNNPAIGTTLTGKVMDVIC